MKTLFGLAILAVTATACASSNNLSAQQDASSEPVLVAANAASTDAVEREILEAAGADADAKICRQERLVGSRNIKLICLTAEEWKETRQRTRRSLDRSFREQKQNVFGFGGRRN